MYDVSLLDNSEAVCQISASSNRMVWIDPVHYDHTAAAADTLIRLCDERKTDVPCMHSDLLIGLA